jgi:hypothetical protein
MKLYNFLNEKELMSAEKVVSILQKDCSIFINQFLHKAPIVVTRFIYGTKAYGVKTAGLVAFTARTDRRPKDLSREWHDYFDNGLKKIFGWKPRSEGVFAYIEKSSDTQWPENLFFLFIKGNFKYVWSPAIVDLYTTVEDYADNLNKESADGLMGVYQDIRGWEAVGHAEIMFKCNSYYLVKTKYLQALKDAKIFLQ